MFTGIIQQLGTIKARKGSYLKVKTGLKTKLGDSVAVNGACLTVVKRGGGKLAFDMSKETLRLTCLGKLKTGDKVNLEPALRTGDALGGHLVSGHVDARGKILEIEQLDQEFTRLRVSLPPALKGLVALKGSVAIDGISLTVTAVDKGWFETVLVPHTLKNTTLGAAQAGDPVNLEADIIARYVQSILKNS